jgi:hypothetical protein
VVAARLVSILDLGGHPAVKSRYHWRKMETRSWQHGIDLEAHWKSKYLKL